MDFSSSSPSCSSSSAPPPTAASNATADCHHQQIDQHEYEHRRENHLGKQLHSEHRFQGLGHQLHRAKLAQIEKQQDATLNRRSEAFKRRMLQLDAEFDAKRKNLMISKQLQLNAVRRKMDAEREIANRDIGDETARVKQRINEQIQEKLTKLAQEERQLEEELGLSLSNGINGMGINANNSNHNRGIKRYLVDEEEMEGEGEAQSSVHSQQQRQNGPQKGGGSGVSAAKKARLTGPELVNGLLPQNNGGRRTAASAVNGRAGNGPRWRDMPAMICQLPRKSILEDLDRIYNSTGSSSSNNGNNNNNASSSS